MLAATLNSSSSTTAAAWDTSSYRETVEMILNLGLLAAEHLMMSGNLLQAKPRQCETFLGARACVLASCWFIFLYGFQSPRHLTLLLQRGASAALLHIQWLWKPPGSWRPIMLKFSGETHLTIPDWSLKFFSKKKYFWQKYFWKICQNGPKILIQKCFLE